MNLIEQYKTEIATLCRKYNVKELYAFGSVLDESKFTNESDVDLLVDFNEIELLKYADNYFEFADSLEELFKRKVDLLTIRSLRNKYFIEAVNKEKEVVYAA